MAEPSIFNTEFDAVALPCFSNDRKMLLLFRQCLETPDKIPASVTNDKDARAAIITGISVLCGHERYNHVINIALLPLYANGQAFTTKVQMVQDALKR